MKFKLQAWWFSQSDYLVVELPRIGEAASQIGLAKACNISSVSNAYSEVYLKPETWTAIPAFERSEKPTLGIVTRDYPHKNLQILPEVKKCLLEEFEMDVDIIVTLTDDEWNARDDQFKNALTNVGPLTITQCPTLYEQLDGVLFLSLLECFSASILEAAMMEKPLIASDRFFVRDVMGEHAIYVDPLNASEIARSVACTFAKSDLDRQPELKAARAFVKERYSAKRRAEDYLNLIKKLAYNDATKHPN